MLHLGDCLDVMQGIPDGSVDAITNRMREATR